MDLLENCAYCKNEFERSANPARVLPCSSLICTNCVLSSSQDLGEYLVECKHCRREHLIASLKNDLPISQLVTDYLANDKQLETNENLGEGLKLKLEREVFEISAHYDAMEMLVHLRAETLIKSIHDTHDKLIDELKICRDFSEKKIEQFKSRNQSKLANSKNLSNFLKLYNQQEILMNNLKSDCFYFKEKSSLVDKSTFGYCFNYDSQKIFKKIENLKHSLQTKETFLELNLKSSLKNESLRSYILPLNHRRCLRIYFTISRVIQLELFDTSSGEIVKSIQAAQCVQYFPIFYALTNSFVLIYIHKPKNSNGNQFCSDQTKTSIVLYDLDLNEVKKVEERASIGSVYANSECILCLFSHRSFDSIKVFDRNLNFKETFGQCKEKSEPFYINRHSAGQNCCNEKLYPAIFGYKNDKIYMHDAANFYVMCRKSGVYLETVKKADADSNFILDSSSNLIEYNATIRHVKISRGDLSVEVGLANKFDQVFLLEDKYLAFVNKQKDSLVIV